MKSNIARLFITVAVLAGLGWASYAGFHSVVTQRYNSLTEAAEKALDHGDSLAAARLASAAMQGRDAAVLKLDSGRAEGLLLEALMSKQAVLEETATRQLPKFTAMGDVIPNHAAISPDGSRAMILHNEQRKEPIYDIYEPPSGRLLARFPMADLTESPPSHIYEFSSDLATAIVWREDSVSFRDTLSGKPVLDTFKAPGGFNRWVVSSDRKRLSASDEKVYRIWDLSANPMRTHDYLLSQYGSGDDFEIAPGNQTLVARQGSYFDGTSRTVVLDLRTNAIRITISSEGPIGTAFSQDGHYLVSSKVGNSGAEYGVQVWDLTTYKPVGPQLEMPKVQAVATLFDGRILAITTTFEGVRFLDRETMRFVGMTADMPRDFNAVRGWSGKMAYSLSADHRLRAYAINPVMAMSGKALVTKACRQWGTKGQMKLTPAEVKAAKAYVSVDPCNGQANK